MAKKKEYKRLMFKEIMREAAVAGEFYPSDAGDLKKEVLGYLERARSGQKRVIGIVSPHAGYSFSGQTAAYSYRSLAGQKFDTFIILGTNHSSSGVCISLEDFKTPLGIVKNDKELSESLAKQKIEVNEKYHSFEHSIEMQLPFLQVLFKNVRIVPIMVSFSDYSECEKFSKTVLSAIKKLGRKVCIIASGDMTHYGQYYNYAPFPPGRSKVYVEDKKAIDLISELRAKEFFEYCNGKTICGAYSISAAISICKGLGAIKGVLLNYANSGDVSKDYSNCVSYASMAFE